MLCSYNSGSFQLSCLRFLNTFLETAASLEERVYIQEEIRLAGLDDFDLESLGHQVAFFRISFSLITVSLKAKKDTWGGGVVRG